MKKIVLLAMMAALSLSAMAQKRVAVYVDGEDATHTNYVTSEMVKTISQSRYYTAVNRSDDFSKQLQNERTYQQSGMVDDKEIAQLGRESGVEYVCAVSIREIASYDYSIEARLIDVESGEIKASDKRTIRYWKSSSSPDTFRLIDEEVKKIGSTITNFESKSYRSGFLQYSSRAKSKVVLNNYGEEQELKESDVRSLLIANPEAFDLYEKGIGIINDIEVFDITKIFWGLLTISGVVAMGVTSPFAVEEGMEWNPIPFSAVCVATGIFAAQWIYKIEKPKTGTKKIKKAIGLYNARNSYADNLELSVGFGMNSVGLTLKF